MDPPSNPPAEATAASQPTSMETPSAEEKPSEPQLITTPELTSSTQSAHLPGATDPPNPLPAAELALEGTPQPSATGLVPTPASETPAQFIPAPDAGPELELITPGAPSASVTASTIQRTPVPPLKPPRSSLFSLPPDLPEMRARFFSLDTPLTLSQDQFKEYWPFVDNVYVKNKERPVTLDNTKSAYYYCRLWKKSDYVGVSPDIRQRKKHCRAAVACPMKFKAVFYGDSHVKLERLGDGAHNHDLDYVDSVKRNSAVRNIAAAEVSKGYKPCDVARNLRESTRVDNLQALRAAGGAYICLKDVHNAGRLKPTTQDSPS